MFDEWISVDDRKPDPYTVVWVYEKKPSKIYGVDVHTAQLVDKKLGDYEYLDWEAGKDSDSDPYDIDPTHWMPFVPPEPPTN